MGSIGPVGGRNGNASPQEISNNKGGQGGGGERVSSHPTSMRGKEAKRARTLIREGGLDRGVQEAEEGTRD